jgi:sugar (pentulose or hexulose) kinase
VGAARARQVRRLHLAGFHMPHCVALWAATRDAVLQCCSQSRSAATAVAAVQVSGFDKPTMHRRAESEPRLRRVQA